MADNKKTYSIVINGIQESVKAVDSLNDALGMLENKIKNLSQASVNVATSNGTSNASSLQTEDKLLKQIHSTEEQIQNARREEYQQLLAEKDLLKEVTNEAQQRAAQERLAANTYANSLEGMKQKLADIKKVMQTTDVSSDTFKGLVKSANELNDKLKELEKQYGQFGRNVGNYDSASNGFNKLKIAVGNTVREFNSSKEALRTLGEELKTLSVNEQGNTQEANELREAYNKLKSAIDDATISSKAMDEAMDFMQSFTAVASVGNGLQAFFGIDDNEITKSIQNLVALQNVLQGLETLRKQMDTSEGFGSIFNKGNDAIDNFTNKLFGIEKATKQATSAQTEMSKATKGVDVASKGAAAAEGVQIATTAGLTVGMKTATVAARALGMALKALGIGIILEGVSLLVEGIKSLGSSIVNSFKTAEKQVDAVNGEFERLKLNYSYLISENNRLYSNGTLSYLDYMTEQLKIQNSYIEKQIDLQRELNDINGDKKKLSWYTLVGDQTTNFGEEIKKGTRFSTKDLMGEFYWDVDNLKEAKEAWTQLNAAVREGKDYFSKYGDDIGDWFSSLTNTVSDTKDLMINVGEGIANDLVGRIQKAAAEYQAAMEDVKNGVEGAEDRLKSARSTVEALEKEMNSDKVTSSIIANLDLYIPDEKVREKVLNIIGVIKLLKQEMNARDLEVKNYFENLAIEILPDYEKAVAKLNKKRGEDIKKYGTDAESIAKINKFYDTQIQKETTKHNEKLSTKRKAAAKDAEAAEKELQSLILANMKDGLYKQLKQLDEERRQRIEKAKINGHKVGEIRAEIEKLYDKKILEAKEEWANKIQQVYLKFWNKIYDLNHTRVTRDFNNLLSDYKSGAKKLQDELDKTLSPSTASYSKAPKYDEFGRANQADFSKLQMSGGTVGDIESIKEYIDLLQKIKILEGQIEEQRENPDITYDVGDLENELEKAKKALQDWYIATEKTEDMMKTSVILEFLTEQNYSKDLKTEYQLRIAERTKYYRESAKISLDEENKSFEARKQLIDENYQHEWRSITNAYDIEDAELKKHLDKGEISQEHYDEAMKRLAQERAENETSLLEKHGKDLEALESEHQENMKRIRAKNYEQQITEYSDFLSRISQEDTSQPIRDKFGFGIVNLSATKKRNKEVLEAYQELSKDILTEKHKLQEALQKNEISFDDFQQAQRELQNLESSVDTAINEINKSTKETLVDFIDSIDQWVQEVGNSVNSILSSLSEIQSNQYDKMIEEQQKYIDRYEELLNKQKEITQEHANEVNSIEGELATARGDRRDALIDKLNAEMDAQRRSLAEEKRLEKQKEAAEKKQKKLEHDQAVAKKKMQLAQAIINTAMAVSMAAVNSWPVPAIPMMALAAATGAAQIAAVQSQNIPSYGDGGVIQGKSHREGGVKVLGGRAEVEGGEFITNKKTTTDNIALLEYINTKKRRVNLDDMIEFYSNGKAIKKNITTVRTKFADGGQIPYMRTDINMSDRLISAFEDYSNRPQVVSVVEILDKMSSVREVQTLAGLDV